LISRVPPSRDRALAIRKICEARTDADPEIPQALTYGEWGAPQTPQKTTRSHENFSKKAAESGGRGGLRRRGNLPARGCRQSCERCFRGPRRPLKSRFSRDYDTLQTSHGRVIPPVEAMPHVAAVVQRDALFEQRAAGPKPQLDGPLHAVRAIDIAHPHRRAAIRV